VEEPTKRAWTPRPRPRLSDAPPPSERNPAAGDALELADEAVPLVERAAGVSWYDDERNDADRAAAVLCLLRRAGAGLAVSSEGGDEAVRNALRQADPEAVVWLASRAVSYMDESGFPELIRPWLDVPPPEQER
jgi:hypothetical protein